MTNPIIFDGTIESFVTFIRKEMLYNDRNALILVTGDPGSGKSTLMGKGVLFGSNPRADPTEVLTTNILYPYEGARIQTRIFQIQKENQRYDFIGVDEAGKGAGKKNWASVSNKAVYEFVQYKREDYQTENGISVRKGNTGIIFCMPDFAEFTGSIKSLARFWIKCVSINDTLGFGIIMVRGQTESEDKWYLDLIEKEAKRYQKATQLPVFLWRKEDFINVYREIPTFFGIVTWTRFTPQEQEIYSRMKAKEAETDEALKGPEDEHLTTREKKQRFLIGKLSLAIEELCLNNQIKGLYVPGKEGNRELMGLASTFARSRYLNINNTTLEKCEDLAKFVEKKVSTQPTDSGLSEAMEKLRQSNQLTKI